MFVTVATEEGNSSQIEVSGDTAVSTIKSRVAKELGVSPGSQVCFNGLPLADDATMTSAGVGAQDLLLITNGGGGSAASSGPTLADIKSLEANTLLAFFKENPQLLRQLHHVDPKLAEAVETGDVVKVRTCVMMQQMNNHKAKWTQETERAALFANPDSEELGFCVRDALVSGVPEAACLALGFGYQRMMFPRLPNSKIWNAAARISIVAFRLLAEGTGYASSHARPCVGVSKRKLPAGVR